MDEKFWLITDCLRYFKLSEYIDGKPTEKYIMAPDIIVLREIVSGYYGCSILSENQPEIFGEYVLEVWK